MEITETMMYDFAKLIGGDLEIDGLGEGNNTRIGLRRPLFRSDLEKIFERWCPKAEEVQQLHEKIAFNFKENSRLSSLISSKEDRINELGDELKAANDRIKKLTSDLEDSIMHGINVTEKKLECQKMNENLIRRLNESKQACVEAEELYKNKIAELKEENKQLKETYEFVVDKSKDVLYDNKELENKCDDYAEANNELGERLAKLEKEYERLGKQNKTLCTFNDLLHSSNRILELDNKTKDEQIAKLKKENEELSSKLYLMECEKAMSNFTKIFAGGEADCSKCVWRENSEKKDERITELMNENELLNEHIIKKDFELKFKENLLNSNIEANDKLIDQNKKYRDTICDQNYTINDLKSELEGATKELKKEKNRCYELEINTLRKQRDKAVKDFKSLKISHEKMVEERNRYKGLTEKLDCCNNSLRDDLNNLKENFVNFDLNDIVVRAMDNIYIVLGDGNHVKGFIIVNRRHNVDITGHMITYGEFRDKFKVRLWCTGEEKYFTEFCLPKAHYELAVYSE